MKTDNPRTKSRFYNGTKIMISCGQTRTASVFCS